MKISISNTNKYNYYYNYTYDKNKTELLKKNTNTKFNENINFNGKISCGFFIKHFCSDPISKFKNFSIEEYSKLTETQKHRLRQEFQLLATKDPVNLFGIGEIHAYAADCIKNTFDNRFGKNNYVVIPIGRSLSSIGKALSLKIGEDKVVNIPMSVTNRFFTNPSELSEYKSFTNNIKNNKGTKNLKKFLELHNLTPKDIDTSGKNYILIDYCYTGESLKGAEQLFKSDEIWGNKKKNIFAVDFLKLLKRFNEDTIEPKIKLVPEKQNILKKIQSALLLSSYKDYATVGVSFNLGNTISASNENQNILGLSKKTKLVWFNILDTIMTGKGNFNVRRKPNFLPDIDPSYQPVKNQEVEPWHDAKSQYVSDLINCLNEINKILIKQSSTKKELNNQSLNEIKQIYKYLCNSYNNINTPSLQNRFNFYKIKPHIEEIIENISSNQNF